MRDLSGGRLTWGAVALLLVLRVSCLSCAVAYGADPVAGQAPTFDESDYRGDWVSFSVDVPDVPASPSGDKCKVTIPYGVQLLGNGKKTQDGKQKFSLECASARRWCKWPLFHNCADEVERCTTIRVTGNDCEGVRTKLCPDKNGQCLDDGSYFTVSDSTLGAYPPNRTGLAYGALAVPFKFELTRKMDIQGSATVGPYLGYRMDKMGAFGHSLEIVGFAGISNLSGTDSKGSSTTLLGFSYGAGLLGTIKGGFTYGGVVGFDHATSGQGFKYQDGVWIALELGYSFSQAK